MVDKRNVCEVHDRIDLRIIRIIVDFAVVKARSGICLPLPNVTRGNTVECDRSVVSSHYIDFISLETVLV